MKNFVRDNERSKSRINQLYISVLGVISSISSGGKSVNTINKSGSELRDIHIPLPYGVSSCPIDGITTHVVVPPDASPFSVGVYDNSRPVVKPGETILYSKFGQTIRMCEDGDIVLTTKQGKHISVNEMGS